MFEVNTHCVFLQYEDAKTELSDLKDKYEKAEQEKQSLADELEDCRANMKESLEKGTKVSVGLSNMHLEGKGL